MKIVIRKIKSLEEFNHIYNLISTYKYDQFRNYPAKSSECWKVYLLQRLSEYAKNNHTYLALKGNEICGLIGFRYSEWDTLHFGFKIGILDYLISSDLGYYEEINIKNRLLSYLDRWCAKYNIKFVSCRIDGDDITGIHSLEHNGFRYIENILQPIIDLDNKKNKLEEPKYVVRLYNENDIDRILEIAKNSQYQRGHFYADPGFDKNKVDQLYEKWVGESIKKKDDIAIIEFNRNVEGYFIHRFDERLSGILGVRIGRWVGAAISSKVRGMSLGYNLFLGTLHLMKDKCDFVDSGFATKNFPSMNIHWKIGFKAVYSCTTYHEWYK